MASEQPADHGHTLEHAGGHEAAGQRERVQGTAAEALDVDPGGADAARLGGHRLGEVAAAALIAVAHRFLAAIEHVVDRCRLDALGGEEPAQRHRGGHLGREVLEEHVGRERGVHLVARDDAPHPPSGAQRERQGGQRPGQSRGDLAVGHAVAEPRQIRRRHEGMGGESGARLGDEAALEAAPGRRRRRS